MWSKISNVLKPRNGHEQDPGSTADVMAKVYEQHPNLSVFHSSTDFSGPMESTPRSPSKYRSRAQSDSAFRSIGRKIPELDINDEAPLALGLPGSPEVTRFFTPEPTTPGPPLLPPIPMTPPPSRHGARSLSDAIFQSMGRSSKPPEADINDDSSSELIVYAKPDPDPFSAHATTYYTPQTMIPATPPQGAAKHVRKTSKEEDIMYTLRTQLALQTELSQQYEVDLRARDELVEALGRRLDVAEKEGERRKGVLKGWKKKVAELERACRHLEEEVDNSRQESMERSVMDEASGEALRMLHRQIAGLEREKSEGERRESVLRGEVSALEGLLKEKGDDVQKMKEVLLSKDESERALKDGIKDVQEQMEMMGNISIGGDEDMRAFVLKTEQANEEQRDKHRAAELEWQEQRAELTARLEALLEEKVALANEFSDLKTSMKAKVDEFGVLKGELVAQWKHTEGATETIEGLQRDKQALEEEKVALKGDVEALEEKIGALEIEWAESENRRANLEADIQELWGEKETLENERCELEVQIKAEREHAEDLTQALQEREDRVAELNQEHQYALENVSRLEENIRQRDAELAEHARCAAENSAEAERLGEEMARMRREHARVVDEQMRALRDTAGQEGETRVHMERLVKERAASDVEMVTLRDRVVALKEEVERLRRHVHELQQESADKEVKIVQITKQRAQDKDDMQGLNIALDSKQQELELLKRRLGVRGTAGSTPVQPSKTSHQRRESIPFSTPGTSRPPSAMSDSGRESVSSKDRKPTDTPTTTNTKSTLGKSLRANLGKLGRIDGAMGPPPPAKGRVSIGTPTPMGRVLSVGAGLTSRMAQGGPQRRASASVLKTSRSGVPGFSPAMGSTQVLVEEKENVDVSLRRRSLLPMPA